MGKFEFMFLVIVILKVICNMFEFLIAAILFFPYKSEGGKNKKTCKNKKKGFEFINYTVDFR